MRRAVVLTLSLLAPAALGPLAAGAAAKQSVTVTPNPVDFGETL